MKRTRLHCMGARLTQRFTSIVVGSCPLFTSTTTARRLWTRSKLYRYLKALINLGSVCRVRRLARVSRESVESQSRIGRESIEKKTYFANLRPSRSAQAPPSAHLSPRRARTSRLTCCRIIPRRLGRVIPLYTSYLIFHHLIKSASFRLQHSMRRLIQVQYARDPESSSCASGASTSS